MDCPLFLFPSGVHCSAVFMIFIEAKKTMYMDLVSFRHFTCKLLLTTCFLSVPILIYNDFIKKYFNFRLSYMLSTMRKMLLENVKITIFIKVGLKAFHNVNIFKDKTLYICTK